MWLVCCVGGWSGRKRGWLLVEAGEDEREEGHMEEDEHMYSMTSMNYELKGEKEDKTRCGLCWRKEPFGDGADFDEDFFPFPLAGGKPGDCSSCTKGQICRTGSITRRSSALALSTSWEDQPGKKAKILDATDLFPEPRSIESSH